MNSHLNEKLDDVIGIYLDDVYDIVDDIDEIQDYFIRVFKCVFRGLNLSKIELFKKYFIHIKTPGNHSTNWEITREEKKMLYDFSKQQHSASRCTTRFK